MKIRKPVSPAEFTEELTIDSFKAGVYPQGTFGVAELNEIQSSYNPSLYEAPILIGHASDYKGQTQIPAFGWVGKVKVVGDHLKLITSEFSDQLKSFIKQGFYKKVSAAFFRPNDPNNPTPGKWHLHHLAFLGGASPAVKGLEGIAFAEFRERGDGLAFAEMDTEVEGIVNKMDAANAKEMTTSISESCATFLAKVEDALAADIDCDTMRSRVSLAKMDLSNELSVAVDKYFAAGEVLKELGELPISENSEKKGRIIELTESLMSLFTKRKESDVTAQQEQAYKDDIAALRATNETLTAKVNEFTEKETARAAEFAAQEKQAAEAAIVAEVAAFCEKAVVEGKMTPAMRVKDEPLMVSLGKTDVNALASFREKYAAPVIPLGEAKEFKEDPAPDARPKVFKDAEAYVKAHKDDKEFKGLEFSDAVNRAMFLESRGKVKFEAK